MNHASVSEEKKRALLRRILLTLGCAVFFPFYVYLSWRNENVPRSYPKMMLTALVVTVAAVQLGYAMLGFLRKNAFCRKLGDWLENNRLEVWLRGSGKNRFFWFCWIVMLLAWTPAFLALYPGTLGYDAIPQIYQYNGWMQLTAYQPFVHTWIMGLIFNTAAKISGSYQIALAVYIVFQVLVVTSAVARMFAYLGKKKVPVIFLLCGLAAIAANPLCQTVTMATTKDVPFAGVFLHLMIAFLELVDAENKSQKTGRLIEVVFAGFLMCELRNQGLYIVAVMAVITLFVCRKQLIVSVSMVLIGIFVVGFNAWATRTFEIGPTDMKEMLSVPIQQSYRVAYNRLTGKEPAEITDGQMAMLATLVPTENMYGYRPDISDPIKYYFNTPVFKADKEEYIRLWYALGKKNSRTYWRAFRDLIMPYWNYNIHLQRDLMFSYTNVDFNRWGIHRDCKMPEYYNYLINQAVHLHYHRNPLTYLMFEPGICLWIMTFAFGWAIINRRKRQTLLTFWNCLLFGTMLLGPAALYRYILPIVLTAPLMLGMLWIERSPACEMTGGAETVFPESAEN